MWKEQSLRNPCWEPIQHCYHCYHCCHYWPFSVEDGRLGVVSSCSARCNHLVECVRPSSWRGSFLHQTIHRFLCPFGGTGHHVAIPTIQWTERSGFSRLDMWLPHTVAAEWTPSHGSVRSLHGCSSRHPFHRGHRDRWASRSSFCCLLLTKQ